MSLMCFLCVFFPARDSHITQLAAVCGDEKFSTYILPRKQITRKLLDITGIEEVIALNISDGLGAFLNVLSKFQTKVILVGHNMTAYMYDFHLLLNALDSCF